MGLLDPRLPDYDIVEWRRRPFHERLRLQCGTWTSQGFGTPWPIHAMYVGKAIVFVLGWVLFAGATEGFGGPTQVGSWWSEPVAFQKAIAWAMLFEGLGFGCGSGPLTGRYLPPFVAFTHFLRPGTTRLPPWPNRNPVASGTRRNWLDVALYAMVVLSLLRVLVADSITTDLLVPVLVLVPLLGLRDKTPFLAFRSEHYLLTFAVFALATDTSELLAGAKAVQLAIWWGAATSKLNRHFPAVVAAMVSNAPLVPERLRRAMFVSAPDDLRPSGVARGLAHGGTVIEYAFPLVLLWSGGGTPTVVALLVMLAFHLFIMSAVALGVPTEWNVLFLYAMFVLFGAHADVRLTALGTPALVALLFVALVGLPTLGNVRPDLVSFLPAMRYYAGNWAASMWFLRPEALERIDRHVTKTSGTTRHQLAPFYDDPTIEFLVGKVPTFRVMHLHGRLLSNLAPRAVDDLEAYELLDGELMAGLVLGWNFGDGHLHDEHLLAALQERCGFAAGDVRCVMVEGQPMGKPWWAWRIVDAATGEIERGRANVVDFVDRQPWDATAAASILGVGR